MGNRIGRMNILLSALRDNKPLSAKEITKSITMPITMLYGRMEYAEK